MPSEDHNEQAHTREDTRTEASFDDLARGLASGTISRGRALRLLGAALVSAALGGGLLADEARAGETRTGTWGGGSWRERFAHRCWWSRGRCAGVGMAPPA